MGMQGVTRVYQGLRGFTGAYKGLHGYTGVYYRHHYGIAGKLYGGLPWIIYPSGENGGNREKTTFHFHPSPSTGILRTHKVTSSQMARKAQFLKHCIGIAEVVQARSRSGLHFFSGSNLTTTYSVVCITGMINQKSKIIIVTFINSAWIYLWSGLKHIIIFYRNHDETCTLACVVWRAVQNIAPIPKRHCSFETAICFPPTPYKRPGTSVKHPEN